MRGKGKGGDGKTREGKEKEWRRKGKMGGTGQGMGCGRERRKGSEREERGYSPPPTLIPGAATGHCPNVHMQFFSHKTIMKHARTSRYISICQ